jgi:hypothetical protein
MLKDDLIEHLWTLRGQSPDDLGDSDWICLVFFFLFDQALEALWTWRNSCLCTAIYIWFISLWRNTDLIYFI